MELHLEITFEGLRNLFFKLAIGVEAGNFVFILVGHQLNQIARHSVGDVAAFAKFCFSSINLGDIVFVGLRIGFILIISQECGALLDDLFKRVGLV